MEAQNKETCPTCGVIIEDGAKVVFSYGAPGTRARLHARVCQFTDSTECINRNEEAIGVIDRLDYYD